MDNPVEVLDYVLSGSELVGWDVTGYNVGLDLVFFDELVGDVLLDVFEVF